jgi:hypothetical protein
VSGRPVKFMEDRVDNLTAGENLARVDELPMTPERIVGWIDAARQQPPT